MSAPSEPGWITIVSGVPRSGTSMMMKMLQAGGMPLLTDGIRTADEDNPEGYCEYERVKKLSQGDVAWLAEARGKAVKVISALLMHLPASFAYRVIFMRRRMDEVLASQAKMLLRRSQPAGGADQPSDDVMADLFVKHLKRIEAWIAKQSNIECLYLEHGDLLAGSADQLERINAFLGGGLDTTRMAAAIHRDLYRQRGAV